MGREVRRVPGDWQHPRDARGRLIPLHKGPFSVKAAQWDREREWWDAGYRRSWAKEGPEWVPRGEDYEGMSYEDYDGPRPVPDEYMPEWPPEQLTHLQMYETCSEGTPISPPIASPEGLARWLAENHASALADITATEEEWLDTIRRGFAVGMAIVGDEMLSGVAFQARGRE